MLKSLAEWQLEVEQRFSRQASQFSWLSSCLAQQENAEATQSRHIWRWHSEEQKAPDMLPGLIPSLLCILMLDISFW